MSENGAPIPFALTLHAGDADQDKLTWSILSQPGFGSADVGSGTGLVSYMPSQNYSGTDAFVVRVSDGQGGTDSITVDVTIESYTGPLLWNQSYDIQYDGWSGVVSSHAYAGGFLPTFGALSPLSQGALGSGYRRSTSGTFTFKSNTRSTQIKWITYRGPNQGKAQVLVDGVVKATVDLYNPIAQWQYPVTIKGLRDVPHTVVVKALNAKNARSTGKWVVVDGFMVGAVGYDDTLINTTKVTLTYGTWVGLLDPGTRFGAYRLSTSANANMGLAFDGTGFDWVTAIGPAYGKAAIYVDGVLSKTVDLYNASRQWEHKVPVTGLPYGHHVLLIKVLGTKNPASTGTGIVNDGFVIN